MSTTSIDNQSYAWSIWLVVELLGELVGLSFERMR
jgi:hypothetical protein